MSVNHRHFVNFQPNGRLLGKLKMVLTPQSVFLQKGLSVEGEQLE